MTAFDPWQSAGPLTRDTLDATVRAVQDRLDLLAVLRQRYDAQIESANERWRTACVLPSTVTGFVGTCAQQDAAGAGTRETPRNLWVSDGDTTRVWRCHSCRRHGDVIDLLEHADSLPRNPGQAVSLRAVRLAAKLAGVEYIMDARRVTAADEPSTMVHVGDAPRRASKAPPTVPFESARALNSRVADRWRAHLRSSAGQQARAELVRRHVTDEQIDRYRLGYAPAQWRDLAGALSKPAQTIAEALGLLGRTRSGNLYDRHRDRIVFPYCEPARPELDRSAAITGFAGRSLVTDPKTPKWLNSVNVPGVWEKRSAVVGLYQAAARVLDTGRVTVGEGGFEALAFDRIGVACVGMVSAEFTTEYVDVLVRIGARRVTLAFDGDTAGRRATLDAAAVLLASGFSLDQLDAVNCPDGSDPDDMPAAALVEAHANPLTLLDFARLHAEQLPTAVQLGFLNALPHDAGEFLRAQRGIDPAALAKYSSRAAGPLTPHAAFVQALSAQPEAAAHLSHADVTAALACSPLLQRRLEDELTAHFGSETQADALPLGLRRAWLSVWYLYLVEQQRQHSASDPFAGNESAEAFRVWFERSEALKAQAKTVLASLAPL